MPVPKPLEWLKEIDEGMARAFLSLREEVHSGKRLTRREKRLCLIAAYAAIGCEKCLQGAIREGIKEGISLEEAKEAASVAILALAGKGVVKIDEGLKGLRDLQVILQSLLGSFFPRKPLRIFYQLL